MNNEKRNYYCIRALTFILRFMPLFILRKFAIVLGMLAYYSLPKWRKRTLSNLALALSLKLTNTQIVAYAKKSFQNIAINFLEYPKIGNMKDRIRCQNPEIADTMHKEGKGIIFFCAHQANWEALFLDGTRRMKGTAIGKPIKNKYLYDWVLSIREKYGGKIIQPRNALQMGFKALKKGIFLGIVGDQGMPDSEYSCDFLGRRAFTSTAPAILAYRTNSPVIFASTRRVKKGYEIHYSDPIWPNLDNSLEDEIARIMKQLLLALEKSIEKAPGEWLWQHNRWKQQTPRALYYRFRHDCLCLILPKFGGLEYLRYVPLLRTIYDKAFITLMLPKELENEKIEGIDEIFYYNDLKSTLKPDYRFKLVFNFTGEIAIDKHYKKYSAIEVVNIATLKKCAEEHLKPGHTFSDILIRALCRPGSLWKKEHAD